MSSRWIRRLFSCRCWKRIEGSVRLRDGDRIAVGVAVLFYRDLTNATTRGHFTDRSDP